MIMSKQAREIYDSAMANAELLFSCSGPHDWEIDPRDVHRTDGDFKTRRCKRCGGVMSALDAFIYDTGVAHGRKAQK